MPTGYTAGIIYGETKTFQDFAKQCMRAFGATIHMRDESMDKEYEPRTPSDYHIKELEKLKKRLEIANTYSDENLIEFKKTELEKDLEYHNKRIQEIKESKIKLESFLESTVNYIPPTDEHQGIKDFMIDQISKTIDFDCSTKYHDEKLSIISTELSNLNANVIRFEMIKNIQKDIDYHVKEQKEEIKRCAESNKWAEAFLSSLQ